MNGPSLLVLLPPPPPPPPPGEGWGGGDLGSVGSVCTLRLFRGWSRGVVPAAESLSFVSPKESNQRKGDPTARVPPLRYGQPAVLAFHGVRANSLRSNTRGPDPRKAALLGTRRGDMNGPLLRSATNGLAVRGLEQGRADACPREDEHGHGHVHVHVRECQRERGPSTYASLHATQGRGQWGRLYLGYLLLARQKKVTRLPGRRPGSCLNTTATHRSARVRHPL
ncbi:hypothetical protein WDL1CHR_01521 [Variovorax sp. WDL1]|nr:hypothetical protein CHC07_02107 [Variovorax sp. B4]PNG57121.1 hypothetical protein CHC06_02110 [Variovorax sp. B2]VTV10571.1 hypothetical protein WDL1CHR_01521 [Variovorax sp. WDL1]